MTIEELRKKYGAGADAKKDGNGTQASAGVAALRAKYGAGTDGGGVSAPAGRVESSGTAVRRDTLKAPLRKGGIQAVTADTGGAFSGGLGTAGGGRYSNEEQLQTATQSYEQRLKELDEIEADLKAFEMATQYAPANQRPVKDIGGFTSSQAAREEYDRVMAKYAALLKENGRTDSNFGRNVRYALEKGGAGLGAALEGLGDAAAAVLLDRRVGKALNGISPAVNIIQQVDGLTGNKVGGAAERMLKSNPSAQRMRDIENRYAPSKAGQVAGEVAQGVGGMLPSIAANIALPGSGMAVLGVQAGGQSAQQALNEGATLEQAVNYGVLSGALEAATEMLSGGLGGLGEGVIDASIGKLIAKNGTAKVGKVLAKVMSNSLVNAVGGSLGEGVEEGITAWLNPYLQRLTYNKDAEKATLGEVLHDAFIGVLTGSVFQGVGMAANLAAGQKNTVSGEAGSAAVGTAPAEHTAQERTDVPQGESPVQQTPANAQKPTQESVSVQRGVVSPTMQGSAQNATVADSARVGSVGPASNGQSNVQNVRFTPGLVQNEFSAKLDATTAKLLDTMGKITNTPIVIEAQVNGGKSNGSYSNGVIRLAADAQNPLLVVGKHEITHRMQELAPAEYRAYRDYAVQVFSAEKSGLVEQYQRNAAEQGENLTHEQALDEIAADFTEMLLTDESRLEQFLTDATTQTKTRAMVQKFFDAVREFINKVRSVFSGERARMDVAAREQFGVSLRQLEKAEQRWKELVRTSVMAEKNTAKSGSEQYSLKHTKDGRPYVDVDVDQNLFDGLTTAEMQDKAKKIIKARFKGTVIGSQYTAYVNKYSAEHFAYPVSRRMDEDIKRDKMRTAPELDTIMEASVYRNNVDPEEGTHPEATGGLDKLDVLYRVGERAYEAEITVLVTDRGRVFYDMTKIKDVTSREIGQIPGLGTAEAESDVSNKKVAQPGGDVKAKSETDVDNDEERQSLKGQSELMHSRLDELNKRYGAIKRGENPARDIQVPKRTAKDNKVSQTVRTVLEAGATPNEALPTIEKMVADGDFSYEVYGDKKAIKDAEDFVKHRGWGDATREWFDRMKKGEVSKKNTAIGWTLYNNAVNSKDMETAIDILNAMVEHQRNAAQAVQATRILKKMSPESQLYAAQKSVQRLQEELNERYGKKTDVELKIDPTLAEELMEAEDQKARDKVLQKIYKDIGRQIPSRFIDKWNAWRYLAMLGNPRTHFRNILGNAFFAPVVATKNLTATAIESAVNRVSGGKTGRTKAVVGFSTEDKGRLKVAWADYADVAEAAMDGGKYSDSANANKYIQEGRQIFGRTDQAKTKIGKAVSGTVGKGAEAARTFNSKALEVEDKWFSQPHYAAALASYCKANGITAEQMRNGGITDEARAYAIKEAQKATYRDTNMLSDFFSRIGRYEGKNWAGKFGTTVVEGILPFRKTPANILARGLEYSPIGLIKSISHDLVQVKNGNMEATQLIDNLSAGLTGTGLLALGAFLAAQGLVRGAGGDDKEKKEFEDLMGHQNYALEIFGKSVTLDWLAPEALPFFVGVNLWEIGEESNDGRTLADWLTAISNVSEPMMEMSCLQSLNDVFDSVGYATSNGLSGLTSAVASAATSYLTQGIPTLLGQLERSAQNIRMTTYTDENQKNLTGDMQYAIGSASGKIPGLDYNQIAYIDAWGRTESTGSLLGRVLNNMVNPSYVSAIDESKMEKELMRLYKATSDDSVFPNRASKYFSVDNKRIDLNGAQYVSYAKKKGQTAYNLLADLTKSSAYAKLTDTDKAKAVGLVYDYANAIAKASVSKYKLEGWIAKADKSRDVVSYILKEKIG